MTDGVNRNYAIHTLDFKLLTILWKAVFIRIIGLQHKISELGLKFIHSIEIQTLNHAHCYSAGNTGFRRN